MGPLDGHARVVSAEGVNSSVTLLLACTSSRKRSTVTRSAEASTESRHTTSDALVRFAGTRTYEREGGVMLRIHGLGCRVREA